MNLSKKPSKNRVTLSPEERRKAYLFKISRPGFPHDLRLNGEVVRGNPRLEKAVNDLMTNNAKPTKA